MVIFRNQVWELSFLPLFLLPTLQICIPITRAQSAAPSAHLYHPSRSVPLLPVLSPPHPLLICTAAPDLYTPITPAQSAPPSARSNRYTVGYELTLGDLAYTL